MAVKAIFFDAAGTLFSSVRPVGQSYTLLAKKYGMEVPTSEVTQRFKSCFASAKPLAFPGTAKDQIKELERSWWENLVRRIFEPFGPFTNFDDYFSELFGYFSRADSWSLLKGTEETLAALRAKGLTLAIISNFDSRLFGILDGLGIASKFDAILISSEIGYAKPAPEIFRRALELFSLTPDQTFFVGDSPETDILGATRAGLTPILLDQKGNKPVDSVRQVREPREILDIVDSQS
jgi:putative hydrolase of the HAD superfamily